MPHRTIHQCIDTTVSLVKLALAVRLYKDAIVSFVCVCVCVCTSGGGVQGAKKIIFTASHSGKLKLAFTSPDIISTSPKSFLTSRIDFTVLPSFKFRKKHHLPVGQVKTEFASPIAQSTSPRLSDTAFFAHCGGGGGMMVPGIPSRDRGNLG